MHRKGFTLIELLVVIAILALLVTILLPTIAHAQALAKLSVCGTRLKAFATAFVMYRNTQRAYPRFIETAWQHREKPTAQNTISALFGMNEESHIQHFWLLVYNDNVPETSFECPGGRHDKPKRNRKYGFDSFYNSSYAFARTVEYSGWARIYDGLKGGVIIAADRPGAPTWDYFNRDDAGTANHGGPWRPDGTPSGYGGNFLNFAGGVQASKTNLLGLKGGNVYQYYGEQELPQNSRTWLHWGPTSEYQ